MDVAIDQGGCFESSHVTSHDDPIYIEEGIVHYCVGNMPGAVALSSTLALTSTTLPYGLTIADMGVEGACKSSPVIAKGLNVYDGHCTYENVATSLGISFTKHSELI